MTYTISCSAATIELNIFGEISDYSNSAREIVSQLNDFDNAGAKEIVAYINSTGGSMLEAMEIYNQIKKFKGKKTAYLGAICASAATYISMAFDTIIAQTNTLYMIHNPQMYISGDENEIQSSLQLLKNIRKDMLACYATKTGLAESEISTLLDATTWLTAEEALAKKFIDEIQKGTITNKFNQTTTAPMANAPIVQALHQIGIEIQNDATDIAIIQAIQNLNTAKVNAETALQSMKDAEKNAKIENLLQKAVEDKKITVAEKESYRVDASTNFELVEKMIAKLPGAISATATINKTDGNQKQETWEWYIQNDAKALYDLQEKDPAKYDKLYADYLRK